MKKRLLLCLICLYSIAEAQTREDSVHQATLFARWLGLQYTAAEADSLLESLQEYQTVYEKMHSKALQNSDRYPFAFDPAPEGYKIDTKQPLLKFELPATVSLPADRSELAFYPVSRLAVLIRTRRISSEELTRFFLDRLKKYSDTLHCVVTLTEDLALQQAREADKEIAAGRYRGPLHGIPYGLKDLFSVKGTRTTWGSTPYREQQIEEDAYVYTKLKAAGAVLCAKLSMGSLAYGDMWFGGKTRNPWNLATGSSGSSAGSASAVSAGLLPFAIGTETWGSIVSPSHTCGVTGLRPSFGSVSRSGGMVLSWSMDKTGPICRNAEDAALVYYYIKGTDGKDPSSKDHAFKYMPRRDMRTLRIAFAENYFRRLPDDAPEWTVLESFRKEGISIIPVNFPDSLVYRADIINIILSAESAAAFDDLTRSNRDDLIERQDKNFWPNLFRAARYIPAVEYINANRQRYALLKTVHSFMNDYDVVIVPTYAGNQSAITNLTGNPAITLPIGLKKNGLPNSITFIGKLYDEASIVEAAKWFQERTGFDELHPPLFKR